MRACSCVTPTRPIPCDMSDLVLDKAKYRSCQCRIYLTKCHFGFLSNGASGRPVVLGKGDLILDYDLTGTEKKRPQGTVLDIKRNY